MIEFQYFEGCPNAKESLSILRAFIIGSSIPEDQLKISLIRSADMAQEVNFQGSPTILIDGIDIYTMHKPIGFNYACRLYMVNGKNTGVLPLEFISIRYKEIMMIKSKISNNGKIGIFPNIGKTMPLVKKETSIKKCPECNSHGVLVKKETIKAILSEYALKRVVGDAFALCMNRNCEISYYSLDSNIVFNTNDLIVPLWYKKDANPIYACYCSKVTKNDVILAIKDHGAKTVNDVKLFTGAMKNSDCLHHNPLGKCCHKIIQEIINEEIQDI